MAQQSRLKTAFTKDISDVIFDPAQILLYQIKLSQICTSISVVLSTCNFLEKSSNISTTLLIMSLIYFLLLWLFLFIGYGLCGAGEVCKCMMCFR